MRKALVIVDMQIMPFVWKDYGGKAVYQSETLVNKTKGLIEKARKSNSPIVYVMHTEKEGSHRAENQPLWHVHNDLSPLSTDKILVKYHTDPFYETDLIHYLSEQNIDSIAVCGLQTEYCVDTAVRSAFSKGLKVELVSDCHSTFDSEILSAENIVKHHNFVLSQFAAIVECDSIVF